MNSQFLRLSALAACMAIVLTAADLDRVQRVETGLRTAIAIKDQPITRMGISERLKFYHVPGASVAVIDAGKLDWARGYGMTSAEGGKPVTTETLFQAAARVKHFETPGMGV